MANLWFATPPVHFPPVLMVYSMRIRLLVVAVFLAPALGSAADVVIPDQIRSHFSSACFACHSDGFEEGGFNFEKLTSGEYGEETTSKWVAAWKNVRAETMPPPEADPMSLEQRKSVVEWIEADVFKLDPNNIDPGVVTIRRLNREEYRNSVNEIVGVNFNTHEEFPADDTGYGFDTIGDVLNMSPVLFEKYLAAAEEISGKAIPLGGPTPPEAGFWSDHWKGSGDPTKLPFDKSQIVRATRKNEKAGRYRIRFDYDIEAAWTRLPETTIVIVRVTPHEGESQELARHEAGWMTRSESELVGEVDLPEGEFTLEVELVPSMPHGPPADPAAPQDLRYQLAIRETKVIGPLNGEMRYTHPASQIFFNGPPSDDREKRIEYAREIIRQRATLAFRRPVDDATVDALTKVAVEEMERPGQRFEHGIKAAISLILASPRFLFRAEGQPNPEDASEIVELDDFDLASRMAFFLWSSVPDRSLLERAKSGELKGNLDETIDWMWSQNWRSERFVRNFVGQWLQLRDIHSVDSNVFAVVGREHPLQEELNNSRYQIRDAMRRETEALFEHLVNESLPVEELLTARYTFANRFNAKAYGLENAGNLHNYKLQRVDLPPESHRRGILTHGSILLVTSNPTRTSPVKRGLFILENLLGTPAPPAPPAVPALEEVTKVDIRKEPLRRVLEAHRESPECAACHQRMDPLGLALEHFDALGLYREVERARRGRDGSEAIPERPINVSGQLLSGESFETLDQLIDILAENRRSDLYRCLTEKMLTYALGRGITYKDAPTIDAIVSAVEADGGSMRTLVKEVIKSKPFRFRRGSGNPIAAN